MSLLSVKNLDKRFGGLHAVKDVSIEVEAGEILGILGPNGAGKTTLYNLLTGFIRPDNGQVLLDGPRVDATLEQPDRLAGGVLDRQVGRAGGPRPDLGGAAGGGEGPQVGRRCRGHASAYRVARRSSSARLRCARACGDRAVGPQAPSDPGHGRRG